jgi:hypothetical protein
MALEARGRGAAERGLALALLGLVLFNRPLLDLFDRGVAAGWAALYLYLFAAWGLLVLLLFLVTRRRV